MNDSQNRQEYRYAWDKYGTQVPLTFLYLQRNNLLSNTYYASGDWKYQHTKSKDHQSFNMVRVQ